MNSRRWGGLVHSLLGVSRLRSTLSVNTPRPQCCGAQIMVSAEVPKVVGFVLVQVSLLSWPLASPSLASLPLLAGGVMALRNPLSLPRMRTSIFMAW